MDISVGDLNAVVVPVPCQYPRDDLLFRGVRAPNDKWRCHRLTARPVGARQLAGDGAELLVQHRALSAAGAAGVPSRDRPQVARRAGALGHRLSEGRQRQGAAAVSRVSDAALERVMGAAARAALLAGESAVDVEDAQALPSGGRRRGRGGRVGGAGDAGAAGARGVGGGLRVPAVAAA
eukprot:CAMPEP_0168431406 /NCGR_PEP_ID=MMETSP0228-20121227/38370_1 /TAXON_ID=133427 /ORGANISM="Protoceratium reticulatum, Strain CCCM 535 (=CCMP 1889)" /LENGTH=178 /DNA_ID=CAMNT_0008445523 /DNA_START=415 /DNA_END=951 /DNA_ORIENTATION=-